MIRTYEYRSLPSKSTMRRLDEALTLTLPLRNAALEEWTR